MEIFFDWRWWLIGKDSIILGRFSANIKKKIDSEPVYNKTFLKTKIKSEGDGVTDLYDKGIPKMDSNHTYLAIISFDSALNKDKKCYLQMFLKGCKYI